MNKKQLIETLASTTGITKKDVCSVLDALSKTIESELAAGGDVTLYGLGVFKVKDRAERKAKNPSTGEDVMVAAHKSPVFKPSSALRELVRLT